jgi:hypothetical protein
MYRPRGRLHSGIELDLAECALVVRHVLVENRGKGLCLLRAQINPLKVAHLDLTLRLLLHGSEDEEKVPNINTHLHAVGIGLAVVGGANDIKIWLCRINHTAHSLAEGREMGESIKGNGPRAPSRLRLGGITGCREQDLRRLAGVSEFGTTGAGVRCRNPDAVEEPQDWCREQDLNLHAFYGTGS